MRFQLDPWVRKIRWRRKWQPIPVFLPGESHGQRSLVGYSPWGWKELDTSEHRTRTPVLGSGNLLGTHAQHSHRTQQCFAHNEYSVNIGERNGWLSE